MSDDRVLLITGASSGIGAATARAAAAAGHRLVLGARSLERLEVLAAELGGPARAVAAACDVTDYDSVAGLVELAIDRFGALDIVFANAGVGGARGLGPHCEDGPERWREMVEINLLGAAYTIRASYEAVVAARGHLLITGSVVGRHAPPGSFYAATKWGITGLAEALRRELVGTGVRVTLVEPGVTDTPFYDNTPQLTLTAEDLARAVMFAVSQPEHVAVSEILVRPTDQEL